MRLLHLVVLLIFTAACGNGGGDTSPDAEADTEDITEVKDEQSPEVAEDVPDAAPDIPQTDDTTELPPPTSLLVSVRVTLDGEPAEKVLVMQAGKPENHDFTLADGTIALVLDLTVVGDISVAAAHPDTRVGGALIYPESPEDEYLIELTRFDKSDNEAFIFDPPGEPGKAPNTQFCGHCHLSILADWFASEHRTSASNVALQDLYSGVSAAFSDEQQCVEKGGSWQLGLEPGTGDALWRCYLGSGVLSVLNPGCDSDGPCDGKGDKFGACADCHAPNINGKLGGRDLFDAKGDAFRWGVQCDACHRVESIDLAAEPGVAGRLGIVRPSEPSPSPTLGLFAPLTFGPNYDSLNVRMGSVQRDHYHEAKLCAGCHEQEQAVLVPGVAIDSERWPSGRLPIHSTFSEWKDGPMNPAAPCQSCHMPPDPEVSNSADQETNPVAAIGWVAGWLRAPGSINHHTWDGPRAVDSGMLESAAAVFVSKTSENGVLTVLVRSKNVGPGHAIPTGEPMRSMVLNVEAHCDETLLTATGGSVVPAFGGYLAKQLSGTDWSLWPGASVGDVIAVVDITGQWLDYQGYGPFGDGTFSAEQKGMRVEHFVGMAKVIFVDGALVTLDSALPSGDVAYRLGQGARAGMPGFGFARVLVDKDGQEMVPHFMAVDVKSDNRLLPQQSFTTTHNFESTCENPVVTATLYHRAYPFDLARERGWPLKETLMVKVVK